MADTVCMTFSNLVDALDGFHAWDDGFTDSGIHDAALRSQVREYLLALADGERWHLIKSVAEDLYVQRPVDHDAAEAIDDFMEWFVHSEFVPPRLWGCKIGDL